MSCGTYTDVSNRCRWAQKWTSAPALASGTELIEVLTIAVCLGRYLLGWLETRKKNIHLFSDLFNNPTPPASSPSIWQDTGWKASTQQLLEKSTPCIHSLLGTRKLFSLTLTHTLTLTLLLPCMPGELNNASVWILPSVCAAFLSQLLSPINLVFNQSTNTLANKRDFKHQTPLQHHDLSRPQLSYCLDFTK